MRRKMTACAAAGAAAFLWWGSRPGGVRPGEAADHVDSMEGSPLRTTDKAADITDVFAFTNTEGHLVLAMNVHPGADSGTRFSDQVEYVFRVRRIDDATGRPSSRMADDARITCVTDPDGEMRCTGSTCEAGEGEYGIDTCTSWSSTDTEIDADASWGLRVFAGLRADPFYLDALWVRGTFGGGQLLPNPTPTNVLAGKNVLSIVAEVKSPLLRGSRIAVAAETNRRAQTTAEVQR